MIQDIFPSCLDNRYVHCRIRREDHLLVFDEEGRVLISHKDGQIKFITCSEPDKPEAVYLFAIDGERYFLLADKRGYEKEGFEYLTIREVRDYCSGKEVYAVFTAYHLWEWYADNRFCGRCGSRLVHDEKERALRCPECGNRVYPRINPAVIVGVMKDDSLLVTRYRSGYAHNALIAGFTEIGETVEETVKREVMEEAGLKVKNIRYYKSQPWGMAQDILMGFFCEADGDAEIHMDENELKYAQWVKRENIVLQPNNLSLTNEMMMVFKENVGNFMDEFMQAPDGLHSGKGDLSLMNDKNQIIYEKKSNVWLDGTMGVVVGDALGCPVQFESRKAVAEHPVTGMRGYGTFKLPEGSWTDDSSLTLATLESIRRMGEIDLNDIMENFMSWLYDGEFTPYGRSFDIGWGTRKAIERYNSKRNVKKCGSDDEKNNGNGSLMRIIPACIYLSEMLETGKITETDAIVALHDLGGLTHAHIRANIACGLYFFLVREILRSSGTLQDRLRSGLKAGFAFYESFLADKENLHYYDRLRDLDTFGQLQSDRIKSSGYVVDTLEAAVWSLITTDSLEQALLKGVNLGEDTDTVGAVAGGLAGLYYGYDAIPDAWLSVIKRREWIEEMCIVNI